jgi:hypothetical protein
VLRFSASAASFCQARGIVDTDSAMSSCAMSRTCELCALVVAGTEARTSSSLPLPVLGTRGGPERIALHAHASTGYPVLR